jgi:hypothetical protein
MTQGLRSTSFDLHLRSAAPASSLSLDDVKQLNIQSIRNDASHAIIEAPFLVKVKKIPSRKEGLQVEAECCRYDHYRSCLIPNADNVGFMKEAALHTY